MHALHRYFKLDDLESFLQDSERAAARNEDDNAEDHLGAGTHADCCSGPYAQACKACVAGIKCLETRTKGKLMLLGRASPAKESRECGSGHRCRTASAC